MSWVVTMPTRRAVIAGPSVARVTVSPRRRPPAAAVPRSTAISPSAAGARPSTRGWRCGTYPAAWFLPCWTRSGLPSAAFSTALPSADGSTAATPGTFPIRCTRSSVRTSGWSGAEREYAGVTLTARSAKLRDAAARWAAALESAKTRVPETSATPRQTARTVISERALWASTLRRAVVSMSSFRR